MTTVYFDGSVRPAKDATWGVLLLCPDGLEIRRRGKLIEWKIHKVEALALEKAIELVEELELDGPVMIYGDDQGLIHKQEPCERYTYAWVPSRDNQAHPIASG